jgi:hypothetical protein
MKGFEECVEQGNEHKEESFIKRVSQKWRVEDKRIPSSGSKQPFSDGRNKTQRYLLNIYNFINNHSIA